MGEARNRRLAEEERRAAEERRRREERERWNAPRGRRIAKPLRVELPHPTKPGELLGVYELHVDGAVYQVVTRLARMGDRLIDTGQLRRVGDPRVIELVQMCAAQKHAGSTQAAPRQGARA